MLRLLLISLLALLAAPAAAPAYTEIPVFRADHATAALPGRDSRDVVLWPDRGPRRTVSSPAAGCTFWAAGAGRLAWDCGATVVVTDLHGGDAREHTAPYYDPDPDPEGDGGAVTFAEEVGSDWIAGTGGAARSQDWTFYFDWRTGAVLSDNNDVSATAFPDLDVPGLLRPLCAGARRAANRSTREGDWGSAHVAGRWVLTSNDTSDTGEVDQPRAWLHHCSSRGSIAIHGVIASALSPYWLAWADKHHDRIVLRRLHSGRVVRLGLAARTDEHSVVLTDRYVYSGAHRRRLPRP
jgi:hypothetical protein